MANSKILLHRFFFAHVCVFAIHFPPSSQLSFLKDNLLIVGPTWSPSGTIRLGRRFLCLLYGSIHFFLGSHSNILPSSIFQLTRENSFLCPKSTSFFIGELSSPIHPHLLRANSAAITSSEKSFACRRSLDKMVFHWIPNGTKIIWSWLVSYQIIYFSIHKSLLLKGLTKSLHCIQAFSDPPSPSDMKVPSYISGPISLCPFKFWPSINSLAHGALTYIPNSSCFFCLNDLPLSCQLSSILPHPSGGCSLISFTLGRIAPLPLWPHIVYTMSFGSYL